VNVLNQAVKKQRAFMVGVPFQNRHHEDEPLEVFERQHTTKVKIPGELRDTAVNVSMRGAPGAWPRLQRVNRVLNNRSLRPRMRARAEYTVRLNAIFETGDKALRCFPVISRKQKREPIQGVHLCCEESAKIFHACVLTGLNVLDLTFLARVHGVVS
jgi:hypothetical protein